MARIALIACFLLLGISEVALAESPNPPVVELEWRVHNPFPFVRSAESYKRLKAGLDHIASNGGFGEYAAAVIESYSNTAWDRTDMSYDRDLIHGTEAAVDVRLTGVPAGAVCSWTGSGASAGGPCDVWQKLDVNTAQQNNLVLQLSSAGQDSSSHFTVAPRRVIIVGMGDSFSSGEGNPDRPFTWKDSRIDRREAHYFQRRWPLFYQPAEDELADWNDVNCHRSEYSWQFLYALDRAGKDPHEIVSFASFACSGAEIYDGLLTVQKDRKGRDKAPGSQLNEAVALLCRVPTVSVDKGKRLRAITDKDMQVTVQQCPEGQLVAPDEVLMTIGGNDVGFAGLIAWASFPANGYTWLTTKTMMRIINEKLVPESGMVCPLKTSDRDYRCRDLPASRDIIMSTWFADNIGFAHELIGTYLGVHPKQIRHLNYPSPTRNEQGKICDFDDSSTASKVMKNELFLTLTKLSPLELFNVPSPIVRNRYNAYSVGPLPKKVADVEKLVVVDLQKKLAGTASKGIRAVDIAQPFKTHGYCAKSTRFELEMVTKDGQSENNWNWWPYNPAEHNPWKHTLRWFRTPNDSQLTMYADRRYGTSAWTSGMFHPNHLGHFSMYATLAAAMRAEPVLTGTDNSGRKEAR